MSRTTSSINKHGSIASAAPQLAAEWDHDKNKSIHPEQVSVYSNLSVWWKCSQGHSWRAQVSSRYRNNYQCKACSDQMNGIKMMADHTRKFGSVASLPIALHWDHDKNLPYVPDIVSQRTRKRFWWACPRCESSWQGGLETAQKHDAVCVKCRNIK